MVATVPSSRHSIGCQHAFGMSNRRHHPHCLLRPTWPERSLMNVLITGGGTHLRLQANLRIVSEPAAGEILRSPIKLDLELAHEQFLRKAIPLVDLAQFPCG